jgi:hypothetical protein
MLAPSATFDKIRRRHAKPLGKLDHTAGADPVGPFFVLLHLLKRDPGRRADLGLAQSAFLSADCATVRRRVGQVRSSSSSQPSPPRSPLDNYYRQYPLADGPPRDLSRSGWVKKIDTLDY